METFEKLNLLVSDEPSRWIEKAQFRFDNKKWLKRSQAVAIRILGELQQQGISQKELAVKMGITPQQVHKWTKGNENFTFETISKLEEALNVNLMCIELNAESTVSEKQREIGLPTQSPQHDLQGILG